ncbi:MAG TPA: M10 family metallopeptidase C-terminal domain-containing protein [Tardiphaga sp.]
MTAYETDSFNGAGIMSSATINISADWITSDGGAYDGKTGIDSYGYQTYIHETGHALGLGHQGPYNGGASYSTDASFANDTWQYSIMSYFSEPNYNGGSYRYVVTPQMADIYAVASIYGAATTRTGDTVYGFHNTGGSIFNFAAYTSAPALTIYDSGGTDTLDCSGYANAQLIDLHPGSFSSVGGLVHNIGIALSTTIEVAIGGSGNDTLMASDTGSTLRGGGGNDTLVGGAGIDQLVGGAGVDTLTGSVGTDVFAFAMGDSSAAAGQHDRISDFTTGVDRIDVSAIDAVSGTSGIVDAFNFLATAIFNGVAGVLDYFFDSARGVTVLQGDTNGDRVADFAIDLTGNIALTSSDLIGIVSLPVVIETSGVTRLTQFNDHFFLYDSVGAGPSLKISGADVLASQIGGLSLIGAEQTAGGYEVAWKFISNGQYTVWNTDSSGNYTSGAIGMVPGSSSALQSLEPSFHQDLNGDGVIGIPLTVIEANGSTSLTQIGNAFFLYDSGGTGPSLKMSGADVLASQIGGLSLIGAEQTAGGYEVAWKFTSNGQYTVWNTDSSGNYTSGAIGMVPGSSSALQSLEPSFHQDLNGDGVIGVAAAAVAENSSVASSNDVVTNSAGNDQISGSAGSDTFVFRADFGNATITNFQPGVDVIEFAHTLFADLSALVSHISDDADGNAVITADAHDTVTLQNISSAALHQHLADFHIV